MKSRDILLVCLMPLAGCGAANFAGPALAAPNLDGNWQLQSAAVTPGSSLPGVGVLLLGSLANSGSSVSGTFRLSVLSTPASCPTTLNQVITVTGTIDANRNLTLSSAPFGGGSVVSLQMIVPPVLSSFGTGTIAISGGSCTFPSAAAIGVEVAPVTGTYSGTVNGSTVLTTPAIPTGTVTLSLTQAASAGADGEFPLSGSLRFSGGGCNNSVAVTGTASGVGVMLASAPGNPLSLSAYEVNAVTSPDASQLSNAYFIFALGPCGTGASSFSEYSGSLTRQ